MSTDVMQRENNLVRQVGLGVAGGLIGGVVFGILMAIWEMLPMVAALINAEGAAVGFIVHLAISAFIGATYAFIAPRLPNGWAVVIGAGAVYGVIWWVLGALFLMPTILGMGEMVFVVEQMQINSLIGHIVFGVLLAASFKLLQERV